MLLVSLICEPKNQPRAALCNDCAVNVGRTLTNQHQSKAILSAFAGNAANRTLCRGIFSLSTVWNIPVRFFADE